MRGITTFIVAVSLFSIALLYAVATLDPLAALVVDMAPGYASQVNAIRDSMVKWSVPVFVFSMLAWAVFWILREERQEVP